MKQATIPKCGSCSRCRSFDLEQDARLRRLARLIQSAFERIRLEELDQGTVRDAIEASGIPSTALSDGQMEILSTPLHLYLFIRGIPRGSGRFQRAPAICLTRFGRKRRGQ